MILEKLRFAFLKPAAPKAAPIAHNAPASALDNSAPTLAQSAIISDWQPALSPDQHAEVLLSWLRAKGFHGTIRSPNLQRFYEEMARRKKLRPRAWNPVAHRLTKLLGGKKTYRWLRMSDGEYHRLRVYEIPKASPAETTERAIRSA